MSATTCNGCTGAYVVFNFNNIGDLNGHTIQPGDKLFVRQLIPSNMAGGVGFCFTNGNCVTSYPAVKDQNGQWAPWASGTGSWNYRGIDLTPVQGLTINNAYMEIIAQADGSTWHVYYDDVVVQWADGTVHPLYTRESSLATSQYGTGQTNPTAAVDISTASADVNNPAQTTYYYHGDQIGSSRLMTSGGGWPVWQGTFLPYGEEYNAQMSTNHYKFTGKERDDESGLDYFGARYYGNALGRFITPDWAAAATEVPYADFADPQSLNLYTYVRNIPTSRTDLDGHAPSDWANWLDSKINAAVRSIETKVELSGHPTLAAVTTFTTGAAGDLGKGFTNLLRTGESVGSLPKGASGAQILNAAAEEGGRVGGTILVVVAVAAPKAPATPAQGAAVRAGTPGARVMLKNGSAVDLTGRSHGGVPTPHIKGLEFHTDPATGVTYPKPGPVRPATLGDVNAAARAAGVSPAVPIPPPLPVPQQKDHQ